MGGVVVLVAVGINLICSDVTTSGWISSAVQINLLLLLSSTRQEARDPVTGFLPTSLGGFFFFWPLRYKQKTAWQEAETEQAGWARTESESVSSACNWSDDSCQVTSESLASSSPSSPPVCSTPFSLLCSYRRVFRSFPSSRWCHGNCVLHRAGIPGAFWTFISQSASRCLQQGVIN